MGSDDVLVIGAGIAGLVAATTAAQAGATVRVLDARRTPGGRARSHDEDGFRFNEGAHALYVAGEAQAALDAFGVRVTGGRPDAGSTHGLGADDRLVPLPSTPVALLRSRLLGVRGKLATARLLGRISAVEAAPLGDVSIGTWLDDRVQDPTARLMAGALVRVATYVDDLDGLSADAAVAQIQRALGAGVRYLDGGWASIVDGLLAAAEAAGVCIETGGPVRAVVADGTDGCEGPAGHRGWTVATAEGARRAATVVLASGGPGTAASLAGAAAPALRRWADDAVPVTASHLDVGFAGDWTLPPVVLGLGRPLYLSLHGPVAGGLAPEGDSLVSTMRYHRAGEAPDPGQDRAELEGLLDVVRPGWRDDARVVRFGARRVVSHDRPRPERGGLPGRPGPEVPDVPDLFVAGDWVGPHGLLADAAASSGRAAGALAAARAARTVPSEARMAP